MRITDEKTWTECDRGDWMIEAVFKSEIDPVLAIRTLCECVGPALVHVSDDELRPRAALSAALAMARAIEEGGEVGAACVIATHDEGAAAWVAVDDVSVYAAAKAAYAAAYAAYAAVYAVSVTATASSYAASAIRSASVTTCKASLQESADIIRERIAWEMIGSAS